MRAEPELIERSCSGIGNSLSDVTRIRSSPCARPLTKKGDYGRTVRIGHEREVFRKYLRELPAGAQIALETSGCYYWIVDEIEQAGHRARLAHALTAKRRMEGRHKTNERDARGWRYCYGTEGYRRCGYRQRHYGMNGRCCGDGCRYRGCGRE